MDWHGNPGNETCSQLLGLGLGGTLAFHPPLLHPHPSRPRPTGPSPALLALQQLPVGGDLDVQGHLDVEKLLVLSQVSRHLLLELPQLLLKPRGARLVPAGLQGKLLLQLPQLSEQRLVLGRWVKRGSVGGTQPSSSTPGAGARSLVLTVPRSPSTSHVRLWIWRRDSFISCLAWRRASWFRLAASDRSAY